jgi:hypothetical protein
LGFVCRCTLECPDPITALRRLLPAQSAIHNL